MAKKQITRREFAKLAGLTGAAILAEKASDVLPGYGEVPFSLSHPKMVPDWHRLVPES